MHLSSFRKNPINIIGTAEKPKTKTCSLALRRPNLSSRGDLNSQLRTRPIVIGTNIIFI